jgi:hypothetical protein
MVEVATEYPEYDIKNYIKDGEQYLKRANYTQAVEAYRKARKGALALKKTSLLDRLDRTLRRARDQAYSYQELTDVSTRTSQASTLEETWSGLRQLGQMRARFGGLGYRKLANLARAARQSVISGLESEKREQLAEKAADHADYDLVLALLEGIQTSENTQVHTLLQRAQRAMEHKVRPRLSEAEMFMTQDRPLDGLGPLQDLRRDLPGCPAWRELWLALCRKQGEFFIDRGRQELAQGKCTAASTTFKKAYRSFERGMEAFPESRSVQWLRLEAKDLIEIARTMHKGYGLQQEEESVAAFITFSELDAQLAIWADQGRDYSLIRYGTALNIKRLQEAADLETTARRLLNAAQTAIEEEQPVIARYHLEQFRAYPEEIKTTLSSAYSSLTSQLGGDTSPSLSTTEVHEEVAPEQEQPRPDDEDVALVEENGKTPTEAETAQQSPTVSSPPPPRDITASPDPLTAWLIEVEPSITAIKAAFLQGDRQSAADQLSALAERLQQATSQQG